ncbi:hypothetical protein [Nitrolancea hollandica]|uniref:Uncharacterized protein n=1 Tax=Nitrolancea hollandica Lb TaxID=1129897 RepID=I4EFF3_9BACT|nr:hypothetical protein [Nitrolancea hollandica]CCF83415.1 hypothetical protein NITHO_2280008 [Nitrolancea hollandica Lb]
MPKKVKPQVRKSELPDDQHVQFSFKFYDSIRSDYCLSNGTPEQVRTALNRLKEISAKTFKQLQQERRVLHFGEVDWSETREKEGFPDPQANVLSAFHFALLGVNGQLARVYAAWDGTTFYIVWFDLQHHIWPSVLRNT